jgi:putative lipoic acid-binding regulatory protein
VERHAGCIEADAVRVATSSNGNFLSITVTIRATSREQLDNIYRDLTADEQILVAL